MPDGVIGDVDRLVSTNRPLLRTPFPANVRAADDPLGFQRARFADRALYNQVGVCIMDMRDHSHRFCVIQSSALVGN
jgi:hypothetical protein